MNRSTISKIGESDQPNQFSGSETGKKEGQHEEGPVAKAIEKQTSKLPSDTFLWLAFGAMGASLSFQLMGKKETSQFIGQWAPSILILGLYNKLVKIAGSEPQPKHAESLRPAGQTH